MASIPRERIVRILVIGLPIMGGMVSNVALGLIDTAMVGVLGNAALAAVGFSSFLAFIYLGMFFGVRDVPGLKKRPATGRSLHWPRRTSVRSTARWPGRREGCLGATSTGGPLVEPSAPRGRPRVERLSR